MAIILINSFVVPQEQEEAFVSTWRSTIDHFVHAPGFIETKLHRNLGLSDQTFLYVNVAQWESVEAYREAFKDFVPAGQRIPGVKAHPGLFEVHTVVKGTQ